MLFRERFGDSLERAQMDLESLVRSAKSAVVGQHPLSDFISPDEKQLRITQIEKEILASVQSRGAANYGIDVRFLGIERLGLPQSVTPEGVRPHDLRAAGVGRQLQDEGDAEARDIRSDADRQAAELLARAQAQATEIRGKGEAEAAKSLAVFQQNPELASFLFRLNALEESLKERSTLIFDQHTPPFDLFGAASNNNPAAAAMPAEGNDCRMNDSHDHHPRSRPGPQPPETPVDAGSQALAEALRSSFAIVKFVMVSWCWCSSFLGSGFFRSAPRTSARSFCGSASRSAKGRKALLGPGSALVISLSD